jgi:hypothetical protein
VSAGEPVSEVVTGEWLTAAECFAWAEKYRSTPWNALALACAADHEPSPIRVLGSLLRLVEASQHPEGLRVPQNDD